ncbi:MAG: phosphate butyryltransferase [Isosphaeraceae bacterium]
MPATPMRLHCFDRLYSEADDRPDAVPLAAAGGDDPTVLEALRVATDCGWVTPTLVGPEGAIRDLAESSEIELDGFTILDAEGDEVALRAVAEVRQGRARLLLKGRIATPTLLRAVLDPGKGLRDGRVVCQVGLIEVARDGRRLLMADTGITIHPNLARKVDIVRESVEVAHALGVARPRVAMLAASESLNPAMLETLHAADLQTRCERGEISGCVVQGPLSFDLAYAAEAGDKKRIGGEVVGAADVLIFPDLLSANLTVKAIMYTADCRFGGILKGTTAPVVFMSRADTPATRLNSLALALKNLC